MRNPAFFDRHPDDWDILDYLSQHDPTSPTYNHQILLDRWTKTLTAIANDTQNTKEQRDKAQFLIDQYKHPGRGSDRYRAREWLCDRQPTKKRKLKSGASVTIFQAPVNQGTFNNTTFNQGVSENLGRASQEPNASCSVDGVAELHGETCQPRSVYQAPVNQGTFNGSTFNQDGYKGNPPEDSEACHPENYAASLTEEVWESDIPVSADINERREEVAAARQTKTSIYDEFLATYKAIPAESKYRFSDSRRVLEDIIFENAGALTTGSSAHLWVIDFDDSAVMSWFEPEEIAELRSRTLPLPEADKKLLASMTRFSQAETADEYRHIAETVPYRSKGENYDRPKHFDAAWVNTVILSMLSILESPNNLLLYPSLCEGWYDCNPWSFLIDQCLLGLDGVLVQRKEIICLALKLVENIYPVLPGKGRHGRRFDAIIHTLGDDPAIEYGAIEVAKNFESIHTKKWVTDSTKLVHALRAMLSRLHKLVDNDEGIVKKLQVVGLMNAGLNMQVIRMNGLNGNVFLLERGKVRTIPTTIESLKRIFVVMMSIWNFKQMIRDCVAVVKSYSGFKSGAVPQTAEELFEELLKQNDL